MKRFSIVALAIAVIGLLVIRLIGNQVDDRNQMLGRNDKTWLTDDQIAAIVKRSICKEQGLTGDQYDQLLNAFEEANARLDHNWRIMSHDEQDYWLDVANDAADKLGYGDEQEDNQ
jgi:hypothetical protein